MAHVKSDKVIVIVGPTASGKTALSLALARRFDGEIISADSRQVYQGMDIGTAKATRVELNGFKHYLVDVKRPDQEYTVSQFKSDAQKAIKQIWAKGKLPIIVGGTGLYVSALVNNLTIPRVKEDKQLRQRLEKDIAKQGLAAVFQRLISLDSEAAYVVDPKNPRRVIRALEVALSTERPFTSQRKQGPPLFNFLEFGITCSPELLRQRIDQRIDQMYDVGLVAEVEGLIKKYGQACRAFDAIGYREVVAYLNGQSTLEWSKNLMKKNTWQYAKRQLTWFRKDKNIHWVRNEKEAIGLASEWLTGD